jgi:hypothetical protein
MNDAHKLTEGKADELKLMLSPRVEIGAIGEERDPEKLNELVFELYKEALSVVNLAAHLLDDAAAGKGGWVRNQAVFNTCILNRLGGASAVEPSERLWKIQRSP